MPGTQDITSVLQKRESRPPGMPTLPGCSGILLCLGEETPLQQWLEILERAASPRQTAAHCSAFLPEPGPTSGPTRGDFQAHSWCACLIEQKLKRTGELTSPIAPAFPPLTLIKMQIEDEMDWSLCIKTSADGIFKLAGI